MPSFSFTQSLVIVIPNSISKSLNVETLHVFIVLLIILAVVFLLHLLLLLLCLHLSGLVVVHLVVHVIPIGPVHDGVLFIKFIKQLHEYLIMVVEALRLNLLSPAVVVRLDVVKNSIDQNTDVWVFV